MISRLNSFKTSSLLIPLLVFITFEFGDTRPKGDIKTLEQYRESIHYIPPKLNETGKNSEGCSSKLVNDGDNTAAAAIAGDIYRWKALYFHIDYTFGGAERNLIIQALSEIERHSCIEMGIVGERNEKDLDYIFIRRGEKGSGCSSHVGRRGGEQIMNLETPECMQKETVMHEVMHGLGYWHEQSRPDRDDFVTIFSEFVAPQRLPNFNIQRSSLTFRLPYDQKSVMHYPENAFSVDNVHRTIIAKNGLGIGSTGELTETDIKKLKIITGCPVQEAKEWHDGEEGVKWNFNCDFLGNDFDSHKSTRGEDCGGLCSQREGCVRFAWLPQDGGTCWLKKEGEPNLAKASHSDGICGFIHKPWKIGVGGTKFDTNCDFWGNDISFSSNVLKEHCWGLCRVKEGCVRFAWRPQDGGTCWLKHAAGSGTPTRGNNPDGICGFITNSWKDGDGGSKWDYNCDFWGNDISSIPNTRREDCLNLCRGKRGCVRFAWRAESGGMCWLKNGNGNAVPIRGNNPDGVCGFIIDRN